MNKLYGVYRGFVRDNDDPTNKLRLKIKVPDVFGNNINDTWALPRGIYTGNGTGFYFIPQKDDLIWVSFENGDANYPLWEYGTYRDGEAPKNVNPNIKLIQTETAKIIIDDEEKTVTVDADGTTIILDKDGVELVGNNEPAVLGDTLADFLNEFLTDIGTIGAIPTTAGVITTLTINTSPLFAPLLIKWQTKFNEIKSKKIKLQ